MMINELTKERVDELLSYDPETGVLTWRVNRGRVRVGAEAGCPDGSGRRLIGIDGRLYKAHRIAWLITHGEFPPEEIDHIDGRPSNNRISNLRAVTSRENGRNLARSRNNVSGITGVYWCKKREKWVAQICIDSKTRHLGRFDSFDDAVAARKLAEALHGFHPNHGREAVA